MVSTRGIKARFIEGERVLCYEPDPTKAKVLYESKVLQIVYNKDGRGRKQIEYLIHFQGWNASWDRCVDEDLVLKDTEENRSLQKTLMETAQIKLKEKKKKRRLSDTIREIVLDQEKEKQEKSGSETGSQTGNTDNDDSASMSSSDSESLTHTSCSTADAAESLAAAAAAAATAPNTNSSCCSTNAAVLDAASVVRPLMISQIPCEEAYTREFPIDIPIALKAVLERDHYLIKEKCKIVRLPCPPAALSVLENYVVFFASRYLARTSERRRNETKLKDKAYLTLDLCKEVMDGVRVCFDFHCTSHLLYSEEQTQATILAVMEPPQTRHTAPQHNGSRDFTAENGKDDKNKSTGEEGGRRLTRSGGRPGNTDTAPPSNSESGRSTPVSSACSNQQHTTQQQQQQQAGGQRILREVECATTILWPDLSHWTLLPTAHRKQGTATLLYGPMHLLRLFVKLPEILYRMNLPPEKRKIILKHIQLFLEYLDVHNQDFFSESHYVLNTE